MTPQELSRRKNLTRELLMLRNQERQLEEEAKKARPIPWKGELEKRIPEKVFTGLESAFATGFSLVFQQGKAVIELGFQKEAVKADHAARNRAVQQKGGRKELRQMHKSADQAGMVNLTMTTVEGIGLGALGIGMPDIVLFLGTLLKGIYETALHYGFSYESRREQLLILKMMEASLSSGPDWVYRNRAVDRLLESEDAQVTEEEYQAQLKKTATAFAVDMLLLKFIQGLPVVGILGGAANPVYYQKVMKYVRLKYRKRYLMKQRRLTL